MRLSNRCYAVTGLGYSAPWCVNAGFIAGDEVTLVVDTGGNALAAQTVHGYASAARAGNQLRVVNTEKHFDHIGGNGFFRDLGIDVWGQVGMARTGAEFAGGDRRSSTTPFPTRLAANAVKPARSFMRHAPGQSQPPDSWGHPIDLGGCVGRDPAHARAHPDQSRRSGLPKTASCSPATAWSASIFRTWTQERGRIGGCGLPRWTGSKRCGRPSWFRGTAPSFWAPGFARSSMPCGACSENPSNGVARRPPTAGLELEARISQAGEVSPRNGGRRPKPGKMVFMERLWAAWALALSWAFARFPRRSSSSSRMVLNIRHLPGPG